MGREIFWGSNEGIHLLRRQVFAKARETAWTVGRWAMTNQRRQTKDATGSPTEPFVWEMSLCSGMT